ncbi:unnamed protein product [Symbiodinium microadriaticum]|nr:unnamed protein product [Symbiodinium microadriaticum]
MVVVNLISDGLYFRLDFTEDRRYTLSDATKGILENLDDVISIKAYFTEDLPPQLAYVRQDLQDQLIEYEDRSKGNIVFEFINPNASDPLKQEAFENGIAPVSINVVENDQRQQLQAFMGVVFQKGDQKEVIPLVQPGNLFLAHANVSGNLQTGSLEAKSDIGLGSWMAAKGVEFGNSFVIDAQCASVTVQQRSGFFTINSQVEFPYFPQLNNFADHPTTGGLEVVLLPFTNPLNFIQADTSLSVNPLILSSDVSGTVSPPVFVDIQKQWREQDFQDPEQVVAASIEGIGPGGGKIIIVSNGEFIVNGEGQQAQQVNPDNVNFASNAVDWLSDDTGLIDLRTKGITNRPLSSVEDGTKNMLKYGNVFDFAVDSTGTRVKVYYGTDVATDIMLGRFGVEGQRSFYTYVRLSDDMDTYVANNFMKMSISTQPEDFRNGDILKLQRDSLNTITFNYPDSAIVLTKDNGIWYKGQVPADSANSASYIQGLNFVTSKKFVEVSAYAQGADWVIQSTVNPEEYWIDQDQFDKVFKPSSDF